MGDICSVDGSNESGILIITENHSLLLKSVTLRWIKHVYLLRDLTTAMQMKKENE